MMSLIRLLRAVCNTIRIPFRREFNFESHITGAISLCEFQDFSGTGNARQERNRIDFGTPAGFIAPRFSTSESMKDIGTLSFPVGSLGTRYPLIALSHAVQYAAQYPNKGHVRSFYTPSILPLPPPRHARSLRVHPIAASVVVHRMIRVVSSENRR